MSKGSNAFPKADPSTLVLDRRGRRVRQLPVRQDFSDREWRRGQFTEHNNYWQAITAGKDPFEKIVPQF